jgi:hypothetical protein
MIENKRILNIKDFDKIEWHDCKIYGFVFDDVTYQFYIDIDFIVEWIEPINENEGFKFRIAPATLVFKNVWDVVFEIETNLSLDIDNVSMVNPHYPKNNEILPEIFEYDWTLTLQQGEISFKSIGFELYMRKSPELRPLQSLGLNERGGISFSTKTE